MHTTGNLSYSKSKTSMFYCNNINLQILACTGITSVIAALFAHFHLVTRCQESRNKTCYFMPPLLAFAEKRASCLCYENSPTLLSEAAWCCSSMRCGNRTPLIIDTMATSGARWKHLQYPRCTTGPFPGHIWRNIGAACTSIVRGKIWADRVSW